MGVEILTGARFYTLLSEHMLSLPYSFPPFHPSSGLHFKWRCSSYVLLPYHTNVIFKRKTVKFCPHTFHFTKCLQHLFNPTEVLNKYIN